VRRSPFLERFGDWLLAGAIIGLAEIQSLTATNLDLTQKVLGTVFGLLLLPLVGFRRRWPLALLAAFVAATVANFWLPDAGEGEAFGVLVLIGLYSAGAHTEGRQFMAAVVLSIALWILITASDPDGLYLGGLVFFGIVVFAPFVVGRLIRARRQREQLLEERAVVLEREREERARAAVADERVRIARELHDVVAHAISVIVLQARGGRKQLDADPRQASHALDAIEETATVALTEMRRLLGLLRESDEELALAPQPTLARVEELVRQVREAGLPVELSVEGEPAALPPGVDLSAYRIVQEALTNVLKHAAPCTARVRVRYGDDELDLEISDDGEGAVNGKGTGHGLTGIRERVAVFGGKVDAGARPGGGYTVRARLPYSSER
jgi:signal transduction histidine kinase